MKKLSAAITLITLTNSALGYLGQLFIAKYFGVGASLDGYWAALGTPTFTLGIVGSYINYSLVPTFSKALARNSEPTFASSAQILRHVSKVICLLSFAGFALSSLFSAVEVPLMLSSIAWLWAGLMMLNALWAAMLNALGRFLVPVLAMLAPPAIQLLSCLLMAQQIGVLALVTGLACGATLAFIVMFAIVSKHVRVLSSAPQGAAIDSTEEVTDRNRLWMVLVALSCFSAYSAIDPWITRFANPGALSALGYSQRLIVALGNFVSIAPFTMVGPKLAEHWTKEEFPQFWEQLYRSLGAVVSNGMPVVTFLLVMSSQFIAVVFQRGAFTSHDVDLVSTVFSIMLVGMLPMLLVTICFRAFFARGDRLDPAILGAIWLGLYAVTGTLLGHSEGAIGVAYSYTGSWITVCTLAIVRVRRSVGMLRSLMRQSLRNLPTVLFGALGTYGVKLWLEHHAFHTIGESFQVASLMLPILVGASLYLGSELILKKAKVQRAKSEVEWPVS